MIYTKMRYSDLKSEKPEAPFKQLNEQITDEYKNLNPQDREKWQKIAEEQNKIRY